MSAPALIAKLQSIGIRLKVENDGANIRVSGKPLTPELRQLVLTNKTELLQFLTRPAANDPTTEPQDWHALDQVYLAHHVNCRTCIAAGQGRGQRCTTGLALWREYEACPCPHFTKH